ncbi:MAG: hypothetical protein KDI19_04350, partial [Pseudomonadales bacterium]|nr:hypothetical protein [Pseudomonadales bacterium]
MITSSGKLNDPGRVIGALEEGQAVHFSVTHECFYEEGCPVVELEAVFERRGSRIIGIVSDKPLDASGAGNLEQVAVQSGVTPFELGSPLPLETIRIPKPWGAEIWYSGIEKRGVCSAGGVPLTWLIAATGDVLLGGPESAPLLL